MKPYETTLVITEDYGKSPCFFSGKLKLTNSTGPAPVISQCPPIEGYSPFTALAAAIAGL